MNYLATITSKRQLTIPVELYQQFDFKMGQKVIISKASDGIKVEPAAGIVERLFGSVKVPKRLKGLTIEQIITRARKEYWRKR